MTLDPIDAQANLLEAVRRRKVTIAGTPGLPIPFDETLGFDMPVFDMTRAFADSSDERLRELYNRGVAAPSPFPEFGIVARGRGDCLWFVIVEDSLGNDRGHLAFRHDVSGWQMLPPKGLETTRETAEANVACDVTMMVTIALLAERSWIETEPASSFYLESVNRGRERGGKPPLRPTIRVSLSRSAPGGGSTGQGSPKSPHDRRSHLRRLRDGRTVAVRSSRIRGGADEPQFYEVHA